LQHRLEEAGVPVTAVYLPHTDHMFDLVGTRWSPAARVTISVLERFLAVISSAEKRVPAKSEKAVASVRKTNAPPPHAHVA